ncbi:MAG TPA: chemotaxis response regulator protein-glutamate methylesterase [Chloroflexota bacterium]|nr:chemotaxis response regulator protein-glutamate methylesterase [Chloroflexota bacterium]
MPDDPLRVLVVDDSALYRQLVRNVLYDVKGVEVVGLAKSGQEALDQIDRLAPDLLTLDVRMPGVDGLGVLRELKRRRIRAKAIMLSSLTANGAQVTTDALLEGAFDFIHKPVGPDAETNRLALRDALEQKLQAFRDSRAGRAFIRTAGTGSKHAEPTGRGDRTPATQPPASDYDAVVIGTSTGGPVALRQVLPLLPGDLPVPVLIVQHMPAQYTHSLAARLNEASQIEVVEACDGMALEPGWAFVAPGGRQMKVVRRGGRCVIAITDDPPENGCRPSADYLFRSAAEVYDGKVVAVVMTGMGHDGTQGCRELKRKGALVIAQHPDGCVVYGMPKAVVDEQLADRIVPLERIAGVVTMRVRSPREKGK